MGRDISAVGVIGLGTMGAGIVEVFAKAGHRVIAVDGTPELAERGAKFVTRSLDRAVSKGKLEQAARDGALARITFTDDLTRLADVDLVVEAVPERMEIKKQIFTALDGIVREDSVLASNTSSLSLTQIASLTKHPGRVIGMHFFNPAPVLKLVEVITTLFTGDELVGRIRDLAARLGKKPVVVRDRAGFVANALLVSYLARAIRTFETGHVRREDLDAAGTVGIGLPMGPLTLCDLIGLDVIKEVCDVLYDATHDPMSAPPALLTQMVTAGRLGRKSGRGFYSYEGEPEPQAPTAPAEAAASAAVVGAGPFAADLAERMRAGGVDVATLDDPTGDVTVLSDRQVVLVLGAGGEQQDESEDPEAGEVAARAWEAVANAIGTEAIVVPLDDESAWAVGEHLDDGAELISARIHRPTKTGQLAEVARGLASDPRKVQTVAATLRAAGLTTLVSRDRAGLVVDALLFPHLNAACQMLDSGYATVADIDTAMTAGCGYPKGPFAMIDEIGADEVTGGLARMHGETGEPALAPSPLLVEHALAGVPFLG